jgi:FAD synthetase
MTNGSHGEADASTPTSTTLREVCADLNARVRAFLAVPAEDETTAKTQEQTRIALGVIERALEEYRYVQYFPTLRSPVPPPAPANKHSFLGLSLSYNGGKDCLVLLILYLAQLHTYFTRSPTRKSSFPTTIPSIYAKPPDPFPSVTSFVESSSTAYHLSLEHITTSDPSTPPPNRVTLRDAFELYLNAHTGIKAIFVGTRRTDPHGKYLTHFDRTDKGWPAFMRIHPVIDWRLSEIWCFLRAKELSEVDGSPLAYCKMYDEGYTSLGGLNDTSKNPKLNEGGGYYRPAYELTEDGAERLGR